MSGNDPYAAGSQAIIDAEHPWPWLEAFPEYAAAFFNGRDEEAQALFRRIVDEPVTVLFGKSGQGKTSLLQAGLFPLLRRERLLPIYVRLAHANGAASLGEQLMRQWQGGLSGFGEAALHFEPPPGLSAQPGSLPASFEPFAHCLWAELHRVDVALVDSAGQPWEPVFVLDQFEEIFTLGAANPDKQEQDFFELGDLLENRMPPAEELAERLPAGEALDSLLKRLKPAAQRYRFLVSLREDYLPELEAWAGLIPRLKANRYRLLPMAQKNAISAVGKTGGALLNPGDAEKIIDYVSKEAASADKPGDMPSHQRRAKAWVEPMMLSLICSGLNEARLKKPESERAKLPVHDLDAQGGLIVERFYENALSGQPESLRQFVEQRLITPDGIRLKCPLATAENMTSREQIRALERKRLVRRESLDDSDFIELIHDRLVPVVRQARDKRWAEERQREEEEKRRQAEERADAERDRANAETKAKVAAEKQAKAERERADTEAQAKAIFEVSAKALGRQKTRLSILSGILFAFMLVMGWLAYHANEAERKATDLQELVTTAVYRSASLQTAFRAQSILNGSQSGSDILAYLQILAADRLMPEGGAQEELNSVLSAGVRDIRNLRRIIETGTAVSAIAIDPAGTTIATGGADGQVKLWNADSGAAMARFQHGKKPIIGLAFGPGGAELVSASNDKTLMLSDARSGKTVAGPWRGHEQKLTGVAFSPDGKIIASSSVDRSLCLWGAAPGNAVCRKLKDPVSGFTSVAFSPDGKQLVSGSNGKAVQIWEVATGKRLGTLLGHAASVTSVAFSPDGSRIVSGSEDQSLMLWDAKTNTLIGRLTGHEDVVTSVAFNRDGTQIVSSSLDQSLRLWDAKTGLPAGAPLRVHTGLVSGVVFGQGGRWLASGGYDKTLRLWNTDSQLTGNGHEGTVAAVAYSPDGRMIVTGSYDQTLRRWDPATGRALGEPLAGHKAGVSSLAFNPKDSSQAVSGSYDKTLRLWNVRTGQPIGGPLVGHWAGVSSVAFSPDGGKIASGGDDGTVRLWTLKPRPLPPSIVAVHDDIVTSVAFSPDGSKILSGSLDGRWRLCDIASNREILLVGPADLSDGITSVAFSPDGRRIVTGGRDLTVRLWDAGNGWPIGQPWRGHADWVSSVAFSRDGGMVVSGSRDRTLRLWNAQTGKPLAPPLSGHKKGVWSVAFSPDGKTIASGSSDKTLQLWPTSATVTAAELCAKLPRNMSHKEWDTWVSATIFYRKQCRGLPIPPDMPEPGPAP